MDALQETLTTAATYVEYFFFAYLAVTLLLFSIRKQISENQRRNFATRGRSVKLAPRQPAFPLPATTPAETLGFPLQA